jgi:hypothetical protein
MKGGIYTDQKCAVCGATLKDDGRRKLCCPGHPDQVATTPHVHCGNGKRRFKRSPEAQRFLSSLRSETDENSFDERDSSNEKPLGYQNPAGKGLDMKKETVRLCSCRNPHSSIIKARDVWGNVKEKNSSPFHFYILLMLCFLISSCASKYEEIQATKQNNSGDQKKAIVLVHGLTGNSNDTWTNLETGQSFPEILRNVDSINNNYAIIPINYPSHIITDNLSLQEIGIWFSYELRNEGILSQGQYNEIIFIAHSLGNLVVRSALYENPEFFEKVKVRLILSLASPSEGSNIADFGMIFLPGSNIIPDLTSSENNQYLIKLNKTWDKYKGDTKIACAYEKYPINGMTFVVSMPSATRICTEKGYPVMADHYGISKPPNQDSRVAKWAINEIRDLEFLSPNSSEYTNFKNAYHRDSNIITYKPSDEIQFIIECIADMDYDKAMIFLNDYDFSHMPSIKCQDVALLLEHVSFSNASNLIEKIHPYMEKSITKGCVDNLKEKMTSISFNKVISLLLQNQ